MSVRHGTAVATPGGVAEADLRRAVSASRSWRGVMRALGIHSSRHARSLRLQCDRSGIDYTHFRSRLWDDDALLREVAAAQSWAELLDALGYARDSGSGRATIRKHAVRLQLDLSRLDGKPQPSLTSDFAVDVDDAHLRTAGAYLVAAACAMRGFKISWPLEPVVYDLLVDTGRHLQRVQVKTTTWRLNGAYACKLTRRSAGEKAWYTKDDIDYFGIVDGDQRVYMIPVEAVDGTGTIIVRRYEAYCLDAGQPPEGEAGRRPGAVPSTPEHEPLG